MANYNRVILIGNLTRDPQLRYTPSQMAVCDFGLAVNRRWNGPDGQKHEEVCFIDCIAWARQAETLAKYTSKGRQILVEGRLTYRTWDGPDGKKRSKHEVTVQTFQFLDSRGDRGGAPGGAPKDAQPATPPAPDQPPPPQAAGQQAAGEESQGGKTDYDFSQDLEDDTIPF